MKQLPGRIRTFLNGSHPTGNIPEAEGDVKHLGIAISRFPEGPM